MSYLVVVWMNETFYDCLDTKSLFYCHHNIDLIKYQN